MSKHAECDGAFTQGHKQRHRKWEFKGEAMLSAIANPSVQPCAANPKWYALQTRSKQERKVATDLAHAGMETYVPLIREIHRWSDRNKSVDVPLFSCYAFVRIAPEDPACGQVLRVPGVLRWVSFGTQPCAIPDHEIGAIRAVLANNVSVASHPFLTVGRRVRIRGGCLNGITGILMANNGDGRLVISIGAVEQAISISVEGYAVEPA